MSSDPVVAATTSSDPRSRLTAAALVLVLAASSIGLGGCATLFASGPDRVPVATNPPGAYVYLNGVFVGQSPTVVSMDRDRPGQIQIYLPGFRPLVMQREKTFNLWFVANVFWAVMIVPIIVDMVTGNYQEYSDDAIAVGLTPDSGPPPTWYAPTGPPYPAPYPPAANPQQPGPYQPQPPPVAPPTVR